MLNKGLHEKLLVQVVDFAESLSQEAEKVLVDPFHHAALQDHVD